MGRLFLKHPGESFKYIECSKCSTLLARKEDILDHNFTSQSGPAMLMGHSVNLAEGEVVRRAMITGTHMVCEVRCIGCNTYVGWKYQYTQEDSQRYKEGLVVLEKAYLNYKDGCPERFERIKHIAGPPPPSPRNN